MRALSPSPGLAPVAGIGLRGPDDEEDRKGKTKAAKRESPVHSAIAALVESRRKSKGRADLLFPEWHGSAHALGKWFAEHRIAREVDERKKGERQSRIDLHSTRRTFAAKAMAALASGAKGYSPWVVADVLGHDREALTLPMTSHYANLSSIEERRACVEAVKLPEPISC